MKKLIQTAGYGRIVSTQSSAKQRNLSICKCINYERLIRFDIFSDYYRNTHRKKFAVNDFTAALQELANHLVSIAIKEQDYAVLLRYFSFGLNRLKSYRVQFEQGEKRLGHCLLMKR